MVFPPTPPKAFINIISRAYQGGTEVTISELFEAMELDEKILILDKLEIIKEHLYAYSLELIPSIMSGDFNSVRILKHSDYLISEERILEELEQGECFGIEFKSSLLYDHKKAQAVPTTALNELRSEGVLYASLKSIAAFLTSGGGNLYIGVNDEGKPIGIDQDCEILGIKGEPLDMWESELRNNIKGKFKEGSTINDYVNVYFKVIDGIRFAIISIMSRRKLSFLKKDGRYRLYRRQGNRTEEVPIEDIEEFIDTRVRNGWS